MTGEELYAFYLHILQTQSTTADNWDDLDDNIKLAWSELARLTCPELSDEAKALLEE